MLKKRNAVKKLKKESKVSPVGGNWKKLPLDLSIITIILWKQSQSL